MISRIVSFVVALAAIAAASGVLVVAAAFALYALILPELGPPGAAACVAVAAAVLIGIVALTAFRKAGVGRKVAPAGAADRLANVLRDKPAIAAAASVAAGLLAWRSPMLAQVLLRLFESKPPAPRARKRG